MLQNVQETPSDSFLSLVDPAEEYDLISQPQITGDGDQQEERDVFGCLAEKETKFVDEVYYIYST